MKQVILLLLIFSLMLFSSCSKEDEDNDKVIDIPSSTNENSNPLLGK